MQQPGKGVSLVMERLIVSGGDELREYALPGASPLRRIRLEGSGALCAQGEELFCACDWGDMIWRMDARLLVPTALFAGGPGMCDMAISPDGARLYALCADADSLLAVSARSGAPLMVNRVGVNPRALALDEDGEVLAVAGGECASAVLLCARTLRVLREMPMPGIVYSVALRGGCVYALCLNEALGSTLTTVLPGGARQTLRLPGMPGLVQGGAGGLIAATHEHLFCVSPDGTRVLRERDAAGRAGRYIEREDGALLQDSLGEALFLRTRGGRWRRVAERARDAAVLAVRDGEG